MLNPTNKVSEMKKREFISKKDPHNYCINYLNIFLFVFEFLSL